ncbi:MAG: hypothetical protein COV99_01595 [Bacteroidetes bacterium CG12_big_fil_rev_8_21_14_0_65_60_17]|nr:MAG: hypothetical protein COV99_01595 [Bacteroidetes bacterium CG12_big_fil_rev_8_21_14_0_65_60_17]
MDNNEHIRFRKILLSLHGSLSREVKEATSADSSITPDNAIGRLTRMEAIQSQAMSVAGKERMKKRIQAIERALTAIDDGTYGTCVRCGEPIPSGRLEVMPESRVCVPCAQRG